MALDGLPLDLPHPFRDVYVLDESGQVDMTLGVTFAEELSREATGVLIVTGIGGSGTGAGGSSRDRRTIKTSRRLVRK